MKFKELTIGQKFEFDHSGLLFPNDLAQGPWVKTSPRCYRADTSPFADNYMARQDHVFWSCHHNEVGSINTRVIKL